MTEPTTQARKCAARRPYQGPADPIRIAAMVLIVCTKTADHDDAEHYDASCDVSWPAEPDDGEFSDTFVCDNDGEWITP